MTPLLPDGRRVTGAMDSSAYDAGYAADRAARYLEIARVDFEGALRRAAGSGDPSLWRIAGERARDVAERERILRDRRRAADQDDLIDRTVGDAELSGFERDVVEHLSRVQATADWRFAISDAVDDVSGPACAIILSTLTDHPEDVVLEQLAGAAVGDEVLIPEAPAEPAASPIPASSIVYYVARRTR